MTDEINAHGITVEAVRKRAWGYLTPSVANDCGITLSDLQQFLAGQYHPDRETLHLLSRRMGML
jgi:hypothetical protein